MRAPEALSTGLGNIFAKPETLTCNATEVPVLKETVIIK
jgi:hypothetical protein